MLSGQRSAVSFRRASLKDFRQLTVWKKAHALTLEIYSLTCRYPRDERFGLTSQIRRSASSVPSNIAEGCGTGSDADFARFLQIAMRSACELEYFLLLSHDLGLLDRQIYCDVESKTIEIKRMLVSLIQKLKADR